MKILYGICGEGFGHSSRAKEIINYLKSRGHKVLILTYGQAYPVLKQFKPIKIGGIELFFRNNKLNLQKTTFCNINKIVQNLKNWDKIKKRIDSFGPDICFSDMEPWVPIISFWYNLPLVSIDNQHRITHLKINIPSKYKKDFLIAKTAVNACISSANEFIILSFTKEEKRKPCIIISPILRKNIAGLNPSKKNYILVYLTKPEEKIISILRNIKEKFMVYGFNKDKKEANIVFKETGRHFIKDLANAKAIIATAGFSLMSEALYLKKPLFAIPLQGQFEQMLNAIFLKKSLLGTYSEVPTEKEIEKFITFLPKYEKKLKNYSTNPKEIFLVLENLLEKYSKNKK